MRLVAMAAFAALGTEEMAARIGTFAAFIQRELDERRAEPVGDYISLLAQGRLEGEEITDTEVPGVLVAFMLGGHHSTAAGLAGLIHHVLTVPGLRARLIAEPQVLGAAVEESLRCSTPLQLFARTAAENTEVQGETIRKGARVMLNYSSANHDPGQYADPEEFRLDRRERGHLAFGAGLHLCQGAALVRTQLRIAITELLAALPDLELSGPVARSGLVGGTLMTITDLPVSFTALSGAPGAPAS